MARFTGFCKTLSNLYPYAGDISYQVIATKLKLTRRLNIISFHVRTQYHIFCRKPLKIIAPPLLTTVKSSELQVKLLIWSNYAV